MRSRYFQRQVPLSRGRVLALVIAVIYSLWLIFFYRFHFVDYFNLALHEAGHPIFGIFGQTIGMLGGTIMQLAFPVVAVISLYRQRGPFEAGLCAIWLAGSLMYTAAYIRDADDRLLRLVGGGIHDFHWLLSRVGWLEAADGLGNFVHLLGAAVAIAGCWMAGQHLRPQTVEQEH